MEFVQRVQIAGIPNTYSSSFHNLFLKVKIIIQRFTHSENNLESIITNQIVLPLISVSWERNIQYLIKSDSVGV